MFDRRLAVEINESLQDASVVFVQGARQVGKSTLARTLPARRYLTLDDATTLAAAGADAEGFVAGLDGPVTIDEVQRVPALALAIKKAVDERRAPGRFLLTGSARLLLLPQLADALVGRMEVAALWPLAQTEIEGTRTQIVDRLFEERFDLSPAELDAPTPRLVRGGYPEVVGRRTARSRARWFESYLTTMLQREVLSIQAIDDLWALPRLLALVASRSGALLNVASLSRQSGIPQTTLRRYLGLLEGAFLVQPLPAWSTNLGKRLTKSPKLYLVDSGLACHLVGADERTLAAMATLGGPLLEGFVVQELLRQAGWSELRPVLGHFRTAAGLEIDVVLEDRRGRLVGVEIKAAASIDRRDLRGMKGLAELTGDRFLRGVVFYTGRDVVPLAANITAVPISALWT